jgi:uncharacterized protein GlcG (DUF336 family)
MKTLLTSAVQVFLLSTPLNGIQYVDDKATGHFGRKNSDRRSGSKAREMGVPMCIAIVDESGQLIAFERMDGGKITSSIIAQDKAYTGAGARQTTESYGAVTQPGNPAYGINSAIGGRLIIVAVALPVVVDGDVVGGIGISSGAPAQDVERAQAGLDHFFKSLVSN